MVFAINEDECGNQLEYLQWALMEDRRWGLGLALVWHAAQGWGKASGSRGTRGRSSRQRLP